MDTVKPIMTLHSEYTEWRNKLSFYKEDLATWQKQLFEMVKRNTSKELMTRVEQLQNQLTVQQEELHKLKHEIKAAENAMKILASVNGVADSYNENEDLKDKVMRFEELFTDFRKNILTFFQRIG